MSQPVYHPRKNEAGRLVRIDVPSTPTPVSSWTNPAAVAVTVPGGEVPSTLNGIAFAVATPPSDAEGWEALVAWAPGDRGPALPPTSKKISAGTVILEPDGRVWLVEPTNQFGGYERTFPKGRAEGNASLAATAAKETFEETGLLVEIGPYLVDVPRTTSLTRYFLAHRIGGTPTDMGWEVQAVCLVPRLLLARYTPSAYDAPIIEAVMKLADEGRGRVGTA